MKTLKIKENTHRILKWIQAQDIVNNIPKKETDIDSLIFKSLVHHAIKHGYNLEPIKNILEEMGDDGDK